MTQTPGQPRPARDPARRILLHWAAAGLLLLQWLTADAYHRTHGSLLPPRSADLLEYAVHRYAGLALGAVVLLQLLALSRGNAVPPADTGWRSRLAKTVHWSLVAVLLGQAVTGVVAVYLAPQAARAHTLLWGALLFLLALHAAGVLFHLLRRDGVVSGILPLQPGRRRTR
ncbi:MAG TPA: cytochrome b/b6 domain-containing protein [Mesorhizobium sp.]|jgi:cytochrome b561|nr:cytochrome b/b6 domain-containing protein [Mesorhizobium sp.]